MVKKMQETVKPVFHAYFEGRKAIQEKIHKMGLPEIKAWFCPKCGFGTGVSETSKAHEYKPKYCKECGVKFDWSELIKGENNHGN